MSNDLIFEEYKKLLMPKEINEIDTEMEELNNKTDINAQYQTIYNLFQEAQKISPTIKIKMAKKQKEFVKQYELINSNFKKIYHITELTPEIQTNFNKYFLTSRIRDKFGAKINMVISTNPYGTCMSFPSLAYYSPTTFNPLDCRDTKEIKLQLFRIQYADNIKECIEKYKIVIAPYIEKTTAFFDKVKEDNHKYFVLSKLDDGVDNNE